MKGYSHFTKLCYCIKCETCYSKELKALNLKPTDKDSLAARAGKKLLILGVQYDLAAERNVDPGFIPNSSVHR